MVKQSRGKIRGIQRGVQKHKIRFSTPDEGGTLIERKISGRNLARIHALAELCWAYLVAVCSTLCLIPLKPSATKQGHFEVGSLRKRLIHYSIVTAVLTLLSHTIVVSVDIMINQDINLKTYMCACYIVILFIASSACSASTLKTLEIQGVINSWGPILKQLEEISGNQPKLFNITNLCMKIIALTWIFHVCAFNASFFSLVFDSLPVCLYPTLKGIGLLPKSNLPHVFWQIALYPLELLTLLLPMIATAFNLSVVAIGLEILRVYNSEMR